MRHLGAILLAVGAALQTVQAYGPWAGRAPGASVFARPASASHALSKPRVGSCRLSEGESGGDDDLMEELRRALSDVSADDRAASDGRVLDGFVDDRKGQLNAPLDDLTRSLDSVEKNIEERLQGELASVESDFLNRIDAAVDSLRQDNKGTQFDPVARAQSGEEDLSASLPDGGLVVIAGAGNPLGRALVRGLGGGGDDAWQLRALLTDGSKLGDAECETSPFAPFAPTTLTKSLAGADAVVIISAAAGGSGGIEPEAVPKLLKALPPGVRRLVMVSVHGVERADKLPYNLQNVFGQLDKQRAAEQEVILKARKQMPGFAVVRMGKLSDDSSSVRPNAYTAAPKSRAALAAGDQLSGELPASAAAAVLVETLKRPETINSTFSLGAPEAAAGGASALLGDEAHWEDEFLKLVGPEVYRRALGILPVDETATWLQEWARRFLRPGAQLTTPVAVQDVDDGVILRFLTRATGYADFDVEETDDQKWAATKTGAAESKAGKPDGALLLVAESQPCPRVRVTRAEMAEGVVVKEMSERSVLDRLERDLNDLENMRRKKQG